MCCTVQRILRHEINFIIDDIGGFVCSPDCIGLFVFSCASFSFISFSLKTETVYRRFMITLQLMFLIMESLLYELVKWLRNKKQDLPLFLQCSDTVGWVIWPVKTRPDMTYNVFGGTLSITQSISQSLRAVLLLHSALKDAPVLDRPPGTVEMFYAIPHQTRPKMNLTQTTLRPDEKWTLK